MNGANKLVRQKTAVNILNTAILLLKHKEVKHLQMESNNLGEGSATDSKWDGFDDGSV
jgi:hypothetical protein